MKQRFTLTPARRNGLVGAAGLRGCGLTAFAIRLPAMGFLLVSLAVSASFPASAQCPEKKLLAPDMETYDTFGDTVALTAGWALCAAPLKRPAIKFACM